MIKKPLIKNLALLPAYFGLMLTATSVQGASQTTNFTVSATVAATCTVSAANLSFGSYTLAQNDAQSNITVTCTNGTNYDVALNAGNGSGATVTARKMTGPTMSGVVQVLNYSLFQDNGRTTNWGSTSTTDVSGIGTGAAVTHTVYGRIPANQTAALGSYTDTITVTVTY